MIIEIFSTSREQGPNSDKGDVPITFEHEARHEVWYASRKSPRNPWCVSIYPSRVRWIVAAKPLIKALLTTRGHVWAKVQSPEKLAATGRQVVYGRHSLVREGKIEEGRWAAGTRSGKRWRVRFTENPPDPELQSAMVALIKAAIKAEQTE